MLELSAIVEAILGLAGLQFVFAWRFHGVYVGLHKEFSKSVADAQKRKLDDFASSFHSFFQKVVDDLREKRISLSSSTREQIATIMGKKEYQQEITNLAEIIGDREGIRGIYEIARDNARTVYLYLMISGASTLLGLLPATNPANAQLNLLYAAFALPLLVVFSAWPEYHRAEDLLVKLRDEPLVGEANVL